MTIYTVENCKTRQALDIIYTIDNLLMVIPKGNQTAQVITKSGKEFLCHSVDEVFWALLSTGIQLVVMMLISGYIIAVNVPVKNKCTSFRFLLILYNFTIIFCSASSLAVLVLY